MPVVITLCLENVFHFINHGEKVGVESCKGIKICCKDRGFKPENKTSRIIQFVEMPVSNLSVSAGTGAFLDEDSFEMVSFPISSVPDGADFGVRVSGDSMEPVYHDGQIVWVKQCDRVNIGEVGIFIYDGESYIKVYDEQEPDKDQREAFSDSYGTMYMQPVMISYNQKYEPRVISAQAGFQVAGRVL